MKPFFKPRKPPSRARRAAGWAAKRRGDEFEVTLERSCRLAGVSCVPIPDGCEQRGRGLVRVKSPFDYILAYKGKTVFIDAKSRSGLKSITPALFKKDDSTKHQLEQMLKLMRAGCEAGFIVYLRDLREVFFVDAKSASSSLSGGMGSGGGSPTRQVPFTALGSLRFSDSRIQVERLFGCENPLDALGTSRRLSSSDLSWRDDPASAPDASE